MEHLIEFDLSTLPLCSYADYGYTKKPILHVDRVAENEVLLLILSGCMPVVEDGKEYFLKAGDIFFLKSGIHHWGKTPFDPDTSWYYVHFKHTQVSDDVPVLTPDFIHKKHIDCTLEDYRKKLVLPKHLHNMLKTDIEDKFKKLIELFNSNNPYLIAYVNPCLHELLVDIYMYTTADRNPDSTSARVKRLYNYLTEHYAVPFDSQEIADYMDLNYKYMGELFKEKTGMTIHECHTRIKIDRGAKLLCETTLPITLISEQLGYADPLYFSNVFKKYNNMSPKAYREKYTSKL